MRPTVGQTLASTVDPTTVVVVRAPQEDVTITCGGVDMVDPKAQPTAPDSVGSPDGEGTLVGKRYADDALGLELLCTKGGTATLEVNGAPLPMKDAKPLPSSD